MVLACPCNLTTLQHYIITLLRFHFPTSLFRTFAVGTDIFVPDVKTWREWFAWMMDNLPLDQLIWETESAVLASVAGYLFVAFTSYPLPFLCLSKKSEGDFVDFASKRGSGTRVVTAGKKRAKKRADALFPKKQ